MKKYTRIIELSCAMKVEVVAENEDRADELLDEYTQSDDFFTDCREMCEFWDPQITTGLVYDPQNTDETEESVTAVEV